MLFLYYPEINRKGKQKSYYVCKKINLVYVKFSKVHKGMHLVNDEQ